MCSARSTLLSPSSSASLWGTATSERSSPQTFQPLCFPSTLILLPSLLLLSFFFLRRHLPIHPTVNSFHPCRNGLVHTYRRFPYPFSLNLTVAKGRFIFIHRRRERGGLGEAQQPAPNHTVCEARARLATKVNVADRPAAHGPSLLKHASAPCPAPICSGNLSSQGP